MIHCGRHQKEREMSIGYGERKPPTIGARKRGKNGAFNKDDLLELCQKEDYNMYIMLACCSIHSVCTSEKRRTKHQDVGYFFPSLFFNSCFLSDFSLFVFLCS